MAKAMGFLTVREHCSLKGKVWVRVWLRGYLCKLAAGSEADVKIMYVSYS